MISNAHRLANKMMTLPIADVREAVALWEQYVDNGAAALVVALFRAGFEPADAAHDAAALPDGREIVRVDGQAYALPIDVHRARLSEAMRAAKKQPVKQQKPGEGLTDVLCPACHSRMAKSPICPNCAEGKQGFKILCACTECGQEVYL